MREIEAQLIRVDQRALLCDVRAERFPQRLMQEMRCRMIGANGCASRAIHVQLDRIADFQRALLDGTDMREDFSKLLPRFRDLEMHALRSHDHAVIADLSAGFAIKGRLIDDDDAFVALFELLYELA